MGQGANQSIEDAGFPGSYCSQLCEIKGYRGDSSCGAETPPKSGHLHSSQACSRRMRCQAREQQSAFCCGADAPTSRRTVFK